MKALDDFSTYYKDFLDGTYDCIDRIVLNAYFIMAQSNGGFRTWWRRLANGGDDNLDNMHLMRFAGRFARRIRAYADKNQIPLIHCQRGDRKHEIAQQYFPKDTTFRGLFCILVGRAPGAVRDVRHYGNGGLNIRKKEPQPYVNHYSFHIIDDDWGHITIKLCPHPPFNAQIMLNGHEYVAAQARKENISFTKEGNCFTNISDAAGLARIADTMRAQCSEGRLVQVCERWIYSACLCFALDMVEQQDSGFHYSYSVYQVEFSRNLIFKSGRVMDQVFGSVIDRTRGPLDIKTVKTIFGHKHRPFKCRGKSFKCSRRSKPPRFEVVVEKPVYNLTVFKVHFGKITIRMYSKGEHVLRIEVVVHNTKALRCGKVIERFGRIVDSLKAILERFLSVLRSVDVSFIDLGKLESWPLGSKVGSAKVGGVDINRPRMRAVMEAVLAVSIKPGGFTVSDIAEKVREILPELEPNYSLRQASYDLKKLRGKQLVHLIDHSRRYEATGDGLQAMTASLVLREKVLKPLLANACQHRRGRKPKTCCTIDTHYENIQIELQKIFKIIGLAA
jgi:predicted RNA-binding protein YlqC (UPF0109 family)